MYKDYKIAIIGLGYVGLPLALEFSKIYKVVGFDINKKRVNSLRNNIDYNMDVDLQKSDNLKYTYLAKDIKDANIYIVTVPTPVTENNIPNLEMLKSSTRLIASCINQDDIVIYESTVYPGVTEDICVPIIEKITGFNINKDFYCGYSPERISPGLKDFNLTNIIKVISGSTKEIALEIDKLYSSIIKETYVAPSIRVAEAAKVVENVQRDVNIALMNELSMIFDNIGIDNKAVLEVARTKWNFINFKPGLVGGHCIGVDPYYLSYKSKSEGFIPELILKSREINDSMPSFIASKTKNLLCMHNKDVKNASVLVLGYTFKENCKDVRNTKVQDLINHLRNFSMSVSVYDPYLVDSNYTNLTKDPFKSKHKYDAIIVTVAHNLFKSYTIHDFEQISFGKLVLLDIKGIYNKSNWSL